jgi:predicted outer membrane protein
MLRYTSAFAALLAASTALGQQAGSPQPGSPQRPAQTTQNQGADQNQTRDRGAARPNVIPATPRNEAPADRADRQPGRGRAGQSAGDRFDSHVADCLILANQEEVALLKFGMERTKNEDVKKLAQSMIKDHEKAIGELRGFASPEHANEELTADQSAPRRDVATTREARKVPADDPDAQPGQNTFNEKLHRMSRRMHEQCLIMSREELSKHEGEEFDMAFLGHQFGMHMGMLAVLKSAGEETSADLSEWTLKAQATTKRHKEGIEKLKKSLADAKK